MAIDVGDTVRLRGAWDVDDTPTSPTAVVCVVLRPDGTTDTVEATEESDGRYIADYDPDEPGPYHYRFGGVGAAKGVEEGRFYVRQSRVLEALELELES